MNNSRFYVSQEEYDCEKLILDFINFDRVILNFQENNLHRFSWIYNPFDCRGGLLIQIHDLNLNTIFFLTLFEKYAIEFNREEWWKDSLKNYDDTKYYNDFESFLRSTVRHIGDIKDFEKKNINLKGDENFFSIYKSFYHNFLNFDSDKVKIIEFYNLIRNTIHNTAFHYSSRKSKYVIYYRNKDYIFENGYPVCFLSIELTLNMINDLLILIQDTLVTRQISSIQILKDDSSKLIW